MFVTKNSCAVYTFGKAISHGYTEIFNGTTKASTSAIPSRLIGGFSLRLLASIKQLGDRAWGANLQRDLSQRLGREVAIGQLYLTLSRLTDHGLISFKLLDPEPVQGGRAKKLFQLEASGEQALDSATVN